MPLDQLSLSLSLLNTTQHTLSTSRFNTISSDVPTQSLHRKLSQKKVKRKDHFFLSFSLSNPPPLSEAKPKHKRVLEREVRRGMYEFVRKTRLEKPSHLHRMTDIHKSSPKSQLVSITRKFLLRNETAQLIVAQHDACRSRLLPHSLTFCVMKIRFLCRLTFKNVRAWRCSERRPCLLCFPFNKLFT